MTGRAGIALLIVGMVAAGATPASATPMGTAAPPPLVASAAAHDVPAAPAAGDGVEVVELDLAGVDPLAQGTLVQADEVLADPAPAEPDLAPGLVVEDPLGALPDAAVTDVLTEEMTVEPFSVMGVSWDLDPALEDVVVQFRTFREGTWTDWGWAAPSEPYSDEAAGAQEPTRGLTDAIFVPDSTGVQIIVSSTTGTVKNVKVVLIDPGAGPSGDQASTSSGTPTPAPVPTPGDATTTPPPAGPLDDPSTSTDAPTEEPVEEVPAPETPTEPTPAPDDPAVESPDPAPPVEVTPGPEVPGTEEPAVDGQATSSTVSVDGPVLGQQPRSAVRAPSAELPSIAIAAATTPQPPIVTRAQWGAPAPACAGGYATSTVAAAVHHTASTNTYTSAQVPGLLRGIAEYHMRPEAAGGRGWCDVGYNFFVDKFGTIYEGRAGGIGQPVIGVHTGGFNSRLVGVSAIGNYQDAPVSAAMAESISRIIAWKFAQHRILANTNVTLVSGGGASKYPAGTAVAFSTIFGHRDAQLTSCPGQYLYALLPDIRNRVAVLSNQTVAESPAGAWDGVAGGGNSIRVTGWATDPDAGGTVQVQVWVDGALAATVAADRSRADVGPHGLDATVAAAAGSHDVCLVFLNRAGGSSVHMGCRTAVATASNPIGVIDSVSASSASLTVAGWALDPDTSLPITVHVYVDGRPAVALSANGPRSDVQRNIPGAGPRHGYSGRVAARAGAHEVCVFGINVGSGANRLIGCRTIVVPSKVAIGSVDAVTNVGYGFSVRGWALDPDTNAPINVHVYVDGFLMDGVRADQDRPDVGRAHGKGSAHGFTYTERASQGRHEVCVYAIDFNGGANPRIGCRTIVVQNARPVGAVDGVTGGTGTLQVRGWALDPDASTSTPVHVYVDGKLALGAVASGSRPDVARVYGTTGAHGYVLDVPAAPGARSVCVYAINNYGGVNPQLGCRSVTVR